ncbi:hypothetical protein LRM49_03110 [Candidatus Nanosynbacter sp. HMT-352]|uniref:hypothetical protein n=1 Tax=Candidatus Nanosynbacter sp. HMT-352 TaxID=2899133 RepID=UPI001FB5E204|nr:hypothetical protein [Candidatus Nanosynbacter sp. HMT-352]UOG67037.1 hypothetical protein LRM49_03110 [Candidatus Nanosynbacter sp. HMT-352]
MKLIKNHHTLKLAIAMSFITLIMILAYGFVSWKSWENVQSVTKNTNEVESSLFINLQKDKLSAEKLNEYLVDLKNKRQSCEVVFFISWQKNVNARFKKYSEECNKSVEKMNRTIQSIEKIVSFMEFDKELIGEIRTVSDELSKTRQNDFIAMEKIWTGAKKRLESRENEVDLRKLAMKRIDAILLAVRDLKSANEKKDSDQFTIARDKFTVAINAWIGLQNELTQESQLRIDNLLREF